MPMRSKMDKLDKHLRAWFEEALLKNNFSKYDELTGELNQKLVPYGITVSRSAVHSAGKEIQNRLEALKNSTMAAKMVAEHAQDDGAELSGAVLAMIHSDMFELMVSMQTMGEIEDPEKRASLLAKMAHAVAISSRSTVNQKRFQTEVEDKQKATLQKLEDKTRAAGGKDAKTKLDLLQQVRQELFGV